MEIDTGRKKGIAFIKDPDSYWIEIFDPAKTGLVRVVMCRKPTVKGGDGTLKEYHSEYCQKCIAYIPPEREPIRVGALCWFRPPNASVSHYRYQEFGMQKKPHEPNASPKSCVPHHALGITRAK